jgi:hypothetical protein
MWTINERRPDHSQAPYNVEQGTLINSKPHQHLRPMSLDERERGLDSLQVLMDTARKRLEPFSERCED